MEVLPRNFNERIAALRWLLFAAFVTIMDGGAYTRGCRECVLYTPLTPALRLDGNIQYVLHLYN